MHAFVTILCSLVFGVCVLFPLILFVVYPLVLAGVSCCVGTTDAQTHETGHCPFLSIVVVARNAESLIESKLKNDCQLDYPADHYEIMVYSDGSDDATEDIVQNFDDPRVQLLQSAEHRGKAHGMNEAVEKCSGDVIVFSDVDALLGTRALHNLVRHYDDPEIGGVCGRRVVGEPIEYTGWAQTLYIGFDSMIKRLESAVGSITSSDGKIHSIRRELFQPVLPGGSDDLDCSLNVVSQKKQFVYEPEVRAYVPTPSKNAHEEMRRRRRIVCGSMKTIWCHRHLFNPMEYGLYGIQLGINKVLRRALPLCLVLLFLSTLGLAHHHVAFQIFALLQGTGYALAAMYPVVVGMVKSGGVFMHLYQTGFYFCVGNLGTLLGLWDYIRGRDYTVWKPTRREVAHT